MRNEELGISTAALLGQRHFSRGVERGRGLYSDPGEAVLYPIWPPMTRATTSSARVHRGRSTDPGHDAIRRKPNFLFHQHLPQIQSQKWRCPTILAMSHISIEGNPMFTATFRHFPCIALASFLLVICGHAVSEGQEPTPTGKKTGLIPRKVLFGNPDKANARISPDGKQLSFLAPVDGVLNVWVGPIDKPDDAKPVTQDKKRGIRSYSWAFTSQHLLYIQDQGGDENWHIYRVDLKSGETKDLTPIKGVNAQIEGVSTKFPEIGR